MTLGDRLKQARREANLSQKDLELKSGVSQKTISKIERGDQESSTQVAQLARACGVNTDWLATESGPMRGGATAREPGAEYESLSREALEIARMWDKLPTERRQSFRDLMALEAIVATHYPWLMFGRPKAESYDQYEHRVERDLLRIAARLQRSSSKS